MHSRLGMQSSDRAFRPGSPNPSAGMRKLHQVSGAYPCTKSKPLTLRSSNNRVREFSTRPRMAINPQKTRRWAEGGDTKTRKSAPAWRSARARAGSASPAAAHRSPSPPRPLWADRGAPDRGQTGPERAGPGLGGALSPLFHPVVPPPADCPEPPPNPTLNPKP